MRTVGKQWRAAFVLALLLWPALSWGQVQCIGDQCSAAGFAQGPFGTVTDIRLSGQLGSANVPAQTSTVYAVLFGVKADSPIATSASPVTDNTAAMGRVYAWLNANSGTVVLPSGVIAYHPLLISTALTPQGGWLRGQGSNCGGTLLNKAPVGTILRSLDTTGDDIAISNSGNPSGYGFKLSNLCIWPRFHKTSGFAINVRSSYNFQPDDINIWYPYKAVNDGGNTYLRSTNLWIQNAFAGGVFISGYDGVHTGVSGGGRSYYIGCQGVNTNPINPQLPSPSAAFVRRSWAGAVTVNSGDFEEDDTNGLVWQLVSTAAQAASPPTLSPSPWNFSDDLAAVNIPSGSNNLRWYASLGAHYFTIDSGAVGNVIEACSPTQGGGSFLVQQNTIGAVGVAPKQTQLINPLGNSFWQAAINFLAGQDDQIIGAQQTTSVTGPVLNIGASYVGGLRSSGSKYVSGGNSSGASFTAVIADGPTNLSFADEFSGAPGGGGGTAAVDNANSHGVNFAGSTIGKSTAGPSTYGLQLEASASGTNTIGAAVFGATAAYNNLSTNDQIGPPVSFTPSPTLGGGSTGMTFSARSGTYIHRPGWLDAAFDFTMSAKGSSTGAAQMPIPLTCLQAGSGTIGYAINMASLISPVSGRVTGGTLNFEITGSLGMTSITDANFTNTSEINGTISCPAAP